MQALGWHGQRIHVTRRWLTLAMIALVSAANAASILLLVHLLVNGAHANAPTLLRAAVHMWVVNVLLFALWYWQLDGGGPAARPSCEPGGWDFLFPQQTEPVLLQEWMASAVPRLPVRLVHERVGVQPHRHDAAQPLGEDADARAVGDEPQPRRDGRCARGEHPEVTTFGGAPSGQGSRMSLYSVASCFSASVNADSLTGVTIDQCFPTGQRCTLHQPMRSDLKDTPGSRSS